MEKQNRKALESLCNQLAIGKSLKFVTWLYIGTYLSGNHINKAVRNTTRTRNVKVEFSFLGEYEPAFAEGSGGAPNWVQIYKWIYENCGFADCLFDSI